MKRDYVEDLEVEFDVDQKTLIHLLKKTILEDLDLPQFKHKEGNLVSTQ